MKHKKYEHRQKFYASREKCTLRTIQNWQRDDAPLDDPEALQKWKAGRQHLPPGTQTKQTVEAVKAVAKATLKQSTLPRGAASALKRLEDAEVNAFEALQAALEAGEPLAIKLSRKNWLEIGDSLRRYELVVEANKRDAGELLPRETFERVLWAFGYTARLAFQDISVNLASVLNLDADRFQILREEILGRRWLLLLASLSKCPEMNLPKWATDALLSDSKCFLGDAILPWLETRAELLAELEKEWIEGKAADKTNDVAPTPEAWQ